MLNVAHLSCLERSLYYLYFRQRLVNVPRFFGILWSERTYTLEVSQVSPERNGHQATKTSALFLRRSGASSVIYQVLNLGETRVAEAYLVCVEWDVWVCLGVLRLVVSG